MFPLPLLAMVVQTRLFFVVIFSLAVAKFPQYRCVVRARYGQVEIFQASFVEGHSVAVGCYESGAGKCEEAY
jgi:hypothetical protein